MLTDIWLANYIRILTYLLQPQFILCFYALLKLPVHHIIVIASVMVTVIFLHKMVDGMDKVVVKELQ